MPLGRPTSPGSRPSATSTATAIGISAAVEITANGARLFLLSGNGAGNFSAQQLANVPGEVINSIVTSGDVNGDGHLDLVANTGDAYQMLVWLGNGAGAFAAPSSLRGAIRREVRLADFNGDGRLDIVVSRNVGPGVSILLNGCGQPAGDLVLSAIDSPDPVAEGQRCHYSSTVTNAGDTLAANVTLTQTLPASVPRRRRPRARARARSPAGW